MLIGSTNSNKSGPRSNVKGRILHSPNPEFHDRIQFPIISRSPR